MEIKITSFPKDSNWVNGTAGGYTFNAKVYDEGSVYGVNEGRVSKLSIRDEYGREIVCYDRGWDIEPQDENLKNLVSGVVDYLERLPKRFD